MSTNSQTGKSSKWGSFFQQAVAGVESRLDTILAEPDEATASKPAENPSKEPEQPAPPAGMTFTRPATPSRSPSTRANDRLQERLARAIVNKQGSPASSTGVPSRTTSPRPTTESRTSLESTSAVAEDGITGGKDDRASIGSSVPRSSQDTGMSQGDTMEIQPGVESTSQSQEDENIQYQASPPDVSDAVEDGPEKASPQIPEIGITGPPSEPPTDYEAAMAQLQADHEASELQWQEELHAYMERIDALQSKLKYLAKEAAESARGAATSAEPGSLEKKLLEKDEQIAALMEEGQKLSKTELDYRATIKKLRQFAAENTKSQAESKKQLEKTERDLSLAQDKAKRAELGERRATEKLTKLARTEKDLEAVTAERNMFSSTVTELKAQLDKAVARSEAAEKRAQANSVETERRRVQELKDDLASAKVEREISEEKLRREIRDLKEGIASEKERARILEIELRGEQSVLESKMESLRSRAEEVSSSATGDAHAKLLRQIETLQTQYAVANENWHGIEGSLLSRLANVEKERDEIAQREADLRRKAREASLKAKRAEGELENSREVILELERNHEETTQEISKLTQRAQKAETDLTSIQQDLTKQKEVAEITLAQRVEEERSRWQQDHYAGASASPSGSGMAPTFPRTESPVAFNRKSASTDALGSIISPSDQQRPSSSSRQTSTLPLPFTPDLSSNLPLRQNSYSSLNSNPQLLYRTPSSATDIITPSSAGDILLSPQTPHTFDHHPEEFPHGGMSTPPTAASALGTYTHTHPSRGGINDIISVSTVAAGPSVQLVERMSATVRRLESERAASRDELSVLTAQRDEARAEVVALMREVEEKRSADGRVDELESRLEVLDQRYQTTLEMLGEKSELVEELRADIVDLKEVYREVIDRTMK
ncbi:hypothetical protein AJ80_07203 [Polytolypa hystricis UAMH7299]|uniref:TATA element modulatory factor 1 TATA binding domain-containing protein n=1 Tax=Polytolypa hystricis (strain UAMH7299) TaxID=1447883 RepID=A0A2B7XRC0_POLH7|nr:hypothetical protein AJ80_07203 [Polytolypa hystricis UAMH7299]